MAAEPVKVDIGQFSSPDAALAAIRRERGFDDAVYPVLTPLMRPHAPITLLLMFTTSAIARTRAVYEGCVREIEHDNSHAAFSLIRQLLETVAVIRYVADHPEYVEVLSRYPDEQKAHGYKRKRIKEFIDYVDERDSSQYGLAYEELCDITHYGSSAMWASYRPGPEEQRAVWWTSTPGWRDQDEFYIACAQLLELAEETEDALRAVIAACTAERGMTAASP